jgi:hypothetical protein
MKSTKGLGLALCALVVVLPTAAGGDELLAQARLVMGSPDVALGGSYEFPIRPAAFENILRDPIILLRLWEVYRFSPRYKARPVDGDGIHLDDPTGISGDIFLAGRTGNSRIYVATGAINHRFVPPFRGKLALVVSADPSENAVRTRLDVYMRMDNRFVGFLARPFIPLIKTIIRNRMDSNVNDMESILADLSSRPEETAIRLKKEDAAVLLSMLSPR